MINAPAANSTRNNGRRRYELALFGVVMFLVTCYFTYASASSFYAQWRASSYFVAVEATIVSSAVETRGGPSSTSGTSFYPAISYRYIAGSTEHQSSRFSFFGKGHSLHESAAAVVAKFPVGAEVQAFYDRSDPAVSVLDNNAPTVGVLAFMLPFFALSAALIWIGLRRRKD